MPQVGPHSHCHCPLRLPAGGAGGCSLAVARLHHGAFHSVLGVPASLGVQGGPAKMVDARLEGACLVVEGHGSSVPLSGEQGGRARQGQGVGQDSPGQQPRLGCPPEPYWRSPASCSQHQRPRSHGPAAQANFGFAQSAPSAVPAAPLPPGTPRRGVSVLAWEPALLPSPGGHTPYPLLQQCPPQSYSLLQLP